MATMQKPEKIYLNNTNLLYALSAEALSAGTLREVFFCSQLKAIHNLTHPKRGDFKVGSKYTFEVGGKGKSAAQIQGLKNAWVVKDDLEHSAGQSIALWYFGLLY